MLALLGHVITFVIAWLCVIAGGIFVLLVAGWFLIEVVCLLLAPFSKKVRDFHEKYLEIHGPWIWW